LNLIEAGIKKYYLTEEIFDKNERK
jgi:hypothetical protein